MLKKFISKISYQCEKLKKGEQIKMRVSNSVRPRRTPPIANTTPVKTRLTTEERFSEAVTALTINNGIHPEKAGAFEINVLNVAKRAREGAQQFLKTAMEKMAKNPKRFARHIKTRY